MPDVVVELNGQDVVVSVNPVTVGLDVNAVTTTINVSTVEAVVSVDGVPGPAGADSLSAQTFPAGENLSGHRAIRVASGLAYYCDGTNAAHTGRCIGITTGAAVQSAGATVQTAGLITEPSWNWSEGPVYVGANGVLTQSLAGLAFIQQVGMAVSATSIDINPQLPIRIS